MGSVYKEWSDEEIQELIEANGRVARGILGGRTGEGEEMREFETGATRDKDDGKYDYEGFLSPIVLEQFAAYMHKHRVQADGTLRDSANWQRGMSRDVYMKSLLRHTFDLWHIHRGYQRDDPKDGHQITAVEAICACVFNLFGYMYEELQ